MAVRTCVPVMALLLLLGGAAAEYTCSTNLTVLEVFMFDFERTFQKAAAEVKRTTFDKPNRRLNLNIESKDTRRNITMWSNCGGSLVNRDACSVRPNPSLHVHPLSASPRSSLQSCLGILLNGLFDVCCGRKSAWGTISLRSDCSVGFSASDYVLRGWSDPGGLPAAVLKEPLPIDFAAAASRPVLPSFMPFFLTVFGISFALHRQPRSGENRTS